jgi:hypothetical protein
LNEVEPVRVLLELLDVPLRGVRDAHVSFFLQEKHLLPALAPLLIL